MSKITCRRLKEINELVKRSSTDEFLKSWRIWFDELFSVFGSSDDADAYNDPLPVKAACLVLFEFFTAAVQFASVAKEISADRLHIFVAKLVKTSNVDFHVLFVLKACLACFPGSCGRLTQKFILPFLLARLESDVVSIRHSAADCFGYLPFLGPSGEKGIKHADNWNKQCKFLLITAHDSLHTLCSGQPSKGSSCVCSFNLKMNESFDLARLGELTALDVDKLRYRTDFCFVCVKSMVTQHSTPFAVDIPLTGLVKLAECMSNLLKVDTYRAEVFSSLVSLCESFFDLLSVVPSLVGISLASFCAELFQILENVLHLFSTKYKQFSSIRASAYGLIEKVVVALGATSKFHQTAQKFWRYAKIDLDFAQVSSDSAEVSSKNKKTSKNKLDFGNDSGGDQFVVKRPNLARARQCLIAGASLIKSTFHQVGSALKPALYRDVQLFLCNLAMNCQMDVKAKLQYEDPECRLSLYLALRSVVMCQHPLCPQAVQCCMQIYERGVFDQDPKVSACSTETLHMLNGLTKPKVPALEIAWNNNGDLTKPVEIDEEMTTGQIEADMSYSRHYGLVHGDEQGRMSDSSIDEDEERIVVNIDSETEGEVEMEQPRLDEDENTRKKFKSAHEETRSNVKKGSAENAARKKEEIIVVDDEVRILNEGKSMEANSDVLQMFADFNDEPVEV